MSDASTKHIVALPQYVFIIRVVQLVLSILIIALVGHTLDTSGDFKYFWRYYDEGPASFVVFDSVWTLLVVGYLIGAPLWLPVAYNMWAHLALEIITTIFWLAGWASLAAWVGSLADEAKYAGGKFKAKWSTAAAGAAFGSIMWVLWIVTAVTFCIRLHKHRTDPANANLSPFGLAEKGQNHEMGNVQAQAPVPAEYPQTTQTPVYPSQTPVYPAQTPTPVQYGQTPPPQQWQQSPPPQQGYAPQ